ncbi:hypothetical protein KIPB_001836 [Kipferlia bialata]|uniref:RNA helicase n=1 Tax=Kipferlia bialata TaxID=797122 RepID=A0A9K3GFE9_9EUKA|nr:hypothetical protein KIPB_001836 [Kipferlia bialata]|eukprot:g1836.t1
MTTFESLGVCEKLCESLAGLGWTTPTDIQAAAIPPALEGKDVIGLAETGSGKTGAFSLPMIQALLKAPQPFFGLVLAPTRELAVQIADVIDAIGSCISLRCARIIGGIDMMDQAIALSKKPHIVVATPGRIVYHMESTNGFSLSQLKYLILDERDGERACRATNKTGVPCKRAAKDNSHYCGIHIKTLGATDYPLTPASQAEPEPEAVAPGAPAAKRTKPEPVMCKAKKKSGEPCKNHAKPGSEYCGTHIKKMTERTSASETDAPATCTAMNKTGKPCTRPAKAGSEYCGTHILAMQREEERKKKEEEKESGDTEMAAGGEGEKEERERVAVVSSPEPVLSTPEKEAVMVLSPQEAEGEGEGEGKGDVVMEQGTAKRELATPQGSQTETGQAPTGVLASGVIPLHPHGHSHEHVAFPAAVSPIVKITEKPVLSTSQHSKEEESLLRHALFPGTPIEKEGERERKEKEKEKETVTAVPEADTLLDTTLAAHSLSLSQSSQSKTKGEREGETLAERAQRKKADDHFDAFWAFVAEVDWPQWHKSRDLCALVPAKYPRDKVKEFQGICADLCGELCDVINDNLDTLDFGGGDDHTFMDLPAECVGRGKDHYYRMLGSPRELAAFGDSGSVHECFSYIFHDPQPPIDSTVPSQAVSEKAPLTEGV